MIPTRLNQHYNSGTVVGFNSSTGSVLVMANSTVSVPRYPGYHFTAIQQSTLANYPSGYKWPSLLDFCSLRCNRTLNSHSVLNDNYFREKLNRLSSQDNVLDRYLVTSDVKESALCCGRYYYNLVEVFERNCYSRIAHVACSHNNGWLIPVLYINGENCDTNET